MKFLLHFSFSTLLLLATLSCKGQGGGSPAGEKIVAEQATAQINWLSFEEAIARNEVEPKQIFIDFYTDWCGWCKVMDRNSFADPEIAKIMNAYFYPVKFNAEGKDTVTFMGQKYGFVAQGNRGYHELAASIMQGKMSYPTFVFLNEKYEIVAPISGYVAPAEFEPIVSYIGQRKYNQNVEYGDYKSSYVLGSTPVPTAKP
jgi:thioredoxin-related protein